MTLFYGYGQTNMFAHSYTKGDHDFPEEKILARFLSDACQPEESVTGTPTSNLFVFVHGNGVSLIGICSLLLFLSSFLFSFTFQPWQRYSLLQTP